MPGRRTLLELVAVLSLAAAAVLLVRDHQRMDSPTLDEPYHAFAAAEYVADGAYWLNLEHPPLAKLLAGLALRPLHLDSPDGGRPRTETPHPEFLRFLYANRAPADLIVAAARRPFPWLLGALVLVTWAGGRVLYGPAAGVVAAAFVALEPNLVGHAALVHTDVPATLAMATAVFLATRAAQTGRALLWGAAGAALGLALATKFTAVVLLPAFVLLPLLVRRDAPLLRRLSGAFLALAVGAAVLAGCYAAAMRRMDDAAAESAVRWYLHARGASEATVSRYAALSRAAPPLGHWAAGLKGVTLFSEGSRGWNYLRGRVYEGPDLTYFPIAFAIKSAPAFLLLLAVAAVAGARELRASRSLALLVPAALVFLSASASSFNIGERHLLPMVPLLAVAAAGALAQRLRPRFFAALSAGLVALSALSVARVHPNELSYFNVLAGGPEGGARWLSDSNVDWGQDMKRLALYLAVRGLESDTTVVCYSGLATNYYSRRVRVLDPARPVEPGRYVVGHTLEALGVHSDAFFPDPAARRRLVELLAALHARGRRGDRVGGSLTVWELPPSREAAPPPAAAPGR